MGRADVKIAHLRLCHNRYTVAIYGMLHIVHQLFRQEQPVPAVHRAVGFPAEDHIDKAVDNRTFACIMFYCATEGCVFIAFIRR